jgi:DNA-3-methyladenine glycosylase I
MAKNAIVLERCTWCPPHVPIYVAYHDEEWGVPVHDDRKLFEMLNLEGAQAGLSWLTVLKKRAHYEQVFDGWDAHKIAAYSEDKVASLLQDPGIIRNKLKVAATIENAKAFIQVCEAFGSFDAYIWQFVGGKPLTNQVKSMKEVPASTPQSDAMSKDLKKRGFKFVGTTICYAFMQAVGMVNDHFVTCHRYREV